MPLKAKVQRLKSGHLTKVRQLAGPKGKCYEKT